MPKARILAVDDQRYFRELMEGLLSSEGYEVETAASGEEALHLLERDQFDVILTDLVMPGFDGCQLVAAVKERDPEQDIVMVTGVVDVKTAVEAMKLGATDYILKPFDRNTLLRSLDNILQRRRLRDEHARLVEENLEYMEVLSLYERAAGLFSTLNLEPLAERLIEGLCLETRAQGGVLWIAENLGEACFRLVGARGLIRVEEEAETIQIERLGDEFRSLVEDGCSVLRPMARSGEADSQALFVPLRHGGNLVALARLSDKLEGGDFDDRDRAAAEKFVGIATGALANSLRFRSLERRSFRDPITKAYNRAYFDDVVRNEIQKANRFGRQFSVVRLDLGSVGALRRSAGEGQLGHWLESVVHQVHQALRSTDILAAESESRFSALLPETDAVGAAVLKERIRRAVVDSGLLDAVRGDMRQEITLASVTFPTDGTQLDALDHALETRLGEHRNSLLRTLSIEGLEFGEALEALMHEAVPADGALPAQVASFLIQEVARRPEDRGMLVMSPGVGLQGEIDQALVRLEGLDNRMEVVVLGDSQGSALRSAPVTVVPPDRLGSTHPFLLYYGEGPAYALVSSADAAPSGSKRKQPIFHTRDRALVEHLAFQLQRDLGIPLGS